MARAKDGPNTLRIGRLTLYAEEIFRQLRPKLRLVSFVCGLLPDFGSGVIRGRLYRLIGMDIGHGAFIMGNIEIVGGGPGHLYQRLSVGPNAVIGTHVTISLDAEVRIGQNVSIGPFVRIYTGTHPIGPGSNRRMSQVLAKPVTIGDGSWIGLGAIILPGVTIGRGSIISAGGVIDRDVPANSYVEGNPGRVVWELPWADR